jgi:PAS domain S-box-containing protein
MHQQPTDPATEVKRLQRCMNDLISVLALPAVWSVSEPSRILDTFLDALLAMLDLDFLYARVRLDPQKAPIDALRTVHLSGKNDRREELRQALNQWSGELPKNWSEQVFKHLGGQEVSVVPIRMGIEGELGLIVAGSQRAGFPEQTESLVLSVAANQAAIGLQQAQRLHEQKQVARELDRRVEERTSELAEANAELQLQVGLLQHLPVSAWTLKPDGTPDFVNRVWLEYSGQTLDFVRSRPEAWMIAVHPEDRETASRAFWDGVRSGQGFAMETRFLRAQDGTYRWHLNRAVVMRDGEGKVLKFVGTSTDIDDRKRAEDELRRSEARYRVVVEAASDAMVSIDESGTIVLANPATKRIFGYNPEELIGKPLTVLMPGAMRTLHQAGFKRYLETGTKRLNWQGTEFTAQRANGEEFPVEISFGGMAADQRKIFTGFIRDISEKKRTEEAILANERNLSLIINTMPVLAWSALPEGTVEFFNQRWLDYTGLSAEQAQGWGWAEAIHRDDLGRMTQYWQSMITTGESGEIEARLRRFDGDYRWFLFRADPVRDASGAVIKWYGTNTDIDDRKRAEEALRASEGKLLRVIDTIPTLSWCNLPDGPNEFLSRSWHEYTGLSPEEAHGWGWTAAFHPDDLPPLMKRWQELLISGEPGEIEARLRRHDGVYRWFLIRVAPFYDETGNIFRWYGTSTDINDRKRAEEELRASETNLREIVDRIPGLVCTMDAAGEIEQLNRPLLEYFGKSPEELKGWKMTDAVHPDDLPAVIEAYTHSVTTGTPYDIEHRCRRADGVYRWFQVRALAVRDAEDRITGWYVLLSDIDDRKRAEEAVRIRELNLLQITETIPEMLWSASPDGAIEYCNGRLLDYTGLSLEQVLRDGWMNLLHPDDVEPTVDVWRSCVESGAPYRVEVRTFHAADNTYRWCVTRALPLLDHEGRIVRWHGTVVDMHDWKRAQEELRTAQAELARITRVMTIGQLTASIAHEVSQPLSGILMNTSTCLRMLKSDPPNIDGARETAQRTIRDGNRASEVITRLRTLFSKKQIDAEPLDLNEAAREVIALLSGELQKNNIILKHEFSDHLPAVNGDRVQLQQVILNFIHNGSDAMVTVNDRPRQLIIRTETDGNHVAVSVQDSGVGFSPEIGERLFEPFFTTKQEGMGIGLSVSRSIVEAHHGRLWAVRNAGPGATFAFSIPQDVGNVPEQGE